MSLIGRSHRQFVLGSQKWKLLKCILGLSDTLCVHMEEVPLCFFPHCPSFMRHYRSFFTLSLFPFTRSFVILHLFLNFTSVYLSPPAISLGSFFSFSFSLWLCDPTSSSYITESAYHSYSFCEPFYFHFSAVTINTFTALTLTQLPDNSIKLFLVTYAGACCNQTLCQLNSTLETY